MRIAIACFSERGKRLGSALAETFRRDGDDATPTRCGDGGPRIGDWAKARFSDSDALLFVGSTGIAVRAIAPYLRGKTVDPAVVVVDERGMHAVSLVSGHIGGANALTRRVASILGASPVITTATDLSGVFAVDVWAAENDLAIVNPHAIKNVSATALADGAVRLRSAFSVNGTLPDGWVTVETRGDVRIDVTEADTSSDSELLLVPGILVMGVGCRKGVSSEAVAAAFRLLCEKNRLRREAFCRVCSIDLKKDESGLIAFCREHELDFSTFSSQALAAVPGEFSTSEFVREVTGIETVCERAAVLGSGGSLRIGKTVIDGVALAVGEMPYSIDFFA